MQYQHILSELRQGVLYVTINRAAKLNALNKGTLDELSDVFNFAANDPQVRAVVLTGSGEKAFVAGADISEFAGYSVEQGTELARLGQEQVFNRIENCPKLVIAAINGFALGGGLELAMSCHIRIASDQARLGLPEVSLGLIPGYGGTQRLTQLVGKGRAIELIATAEMITAARAEQIGLVNHVVPAKDLLDKAGEILGKILLRAPLAVSAAIRAVNAAGQKDTNGYETEIEAFGQCFGTSDFKEGVRAFLNKQTPVFRGQ